MQNDKVNKQENASKNNYLQIYCAGSFKESARVGIKCFLGVRCHRQGIATMAKHSLMWKKCMHALKLYQFFFIYIISPKHTVQIELK